jgi:DNA-binding response OmpR family regulator
MDSVFIVEDDRKIRTELTKLLQKYGYCCYTSDDFSHMPDVILKQNPQLVLLDLNLPVYDGFYICRELRRHSKIPIIVVTSRSTDMDELMSMNLGADDFITKPYNTQILLARIAAVMARTYPEKAPDKISYRGLTVNFSQSVAEAEGEKAELTKNELRILSILLRNRGRITTRNDMMNALWQSDEFVDDNTLTVNINRLRKKLESIGVHSYLITKRGQGYMI